jgi:ParB family chromosome partitioning protein
MAALVENLQRQDLDFIEEALGIQRLLRDWDMSQEQAARMLGKSQSSVANKLRILKHSEAVLLRIRETGLTERHARALLKLPGEPETLGAIAEITRQGMSVARAENYIDSLLAAPRTPARKANVSSFLNSLTQNLQKIQLSGIPAVSERRETDSQIVLTITIPK